MTHIQSAGDLFEEFLGDISYPPDSEAGKLFPFFVRLGVIKRRPPRHPYFEYIIDMGRADIEKICNKEPIDKSHLTFVFPERWLGVAEKQAFMSLITENPSVEQIKQVDIVTNEPMIVGNFYSQQVRVVTWPEDSGVYDCHAYPT